MSNLKNQKIFCFFLLSFIFLGKAQAKNPIFQDTIRHKIKKGETLTAIVAKYDVTGTDILKWNKKIKKLDQIKANDVLLIVRDSKKANYTAKTDDKAEKKPNNTNDTPPKSSQGNAPSTGSPLLAIKYRVKYGELLGTIARKFNTTSEAIQEASGLESINSIKVGTELTIYPKNNQGQPIYDFGEKTAQGNNTQNEIPKTQVTENQDSNQNKPPKTGVLNDIQMIDYIVKEGDVLGKLAQSYGTTVLKIQETNLIMHPKDLKVGMKIKIPASKIPEPEVPKTAETSSVSKSDAEKLALGEPVDYTVRMNDTVESIANKFGINPDDIRKDNDITDDKNLKIGMKLLIFKRN